MTFRIVIVFIVFLSLADTTVVSSQETKKVNPTDISEQRVLSDLSVEESEWYRKFHEGVMFFDGWNEIAADILETFPQEVADQKKQMVDRLGMKIASEWCRNNEVRKIDTDMLKSWGKKIRNAVAKGPEDTERILREIENEVDRLLQVSNRLSLFSSQS